MSHKKRMLDAQEEKLRTSIKRQSKALVLDMATKGLILDTQTGLFEKSLAQILAQAFDERHPKLQALEMLPVVPTIQMGVGSVISRGHTHLGEATITTSYDTEISRVEVQGREHAMIVAGVINSFFIAYQQIQAAAFSGVPLPTYLAKAAYRIVEEGIDLILSLGYASHGITGMLNNAGVTRWQGGVTAGITGSWADVATTDAQILMDLDLMVAQVEDGSRFVPTDMAVGPLEYNRLLRPQAAAQYMPNLLKVIEVGRGLKINKWERLRRIPAAVAAGGVAVASCVLYEKNADVFNPHLSPGPEQYPPKVELAGYRIAVHRRCGGVESANPRGALYLDMA